MGYPNPIFITGASIRCGANFLTRLINIHPNCSRSKIQEDNIVANSDSLFNFIDNIGEDWDNKTKFDEEEIKSKITPIFGEAIIRFLDPDPSNLNNRILIKNSTPKNVSKLLKLFPSGKIVFILRDVRSAVESMVLAFNKSYNESISSWLDGSRTIIQYLESFSNSNNHLFVKYEDLVNSLKPTMNDILNFLDLDVRLYDYEIAENLPVIGSSSFYGENRQRIHWNPVEKTEDFNPLKRWEHWDDYLLRKCNNECGKEMKELGYVL